MDILKAIDATVPSAYQFSFQKEVNNWVLRNSIETQSLILGFFCMGCIAL